MHLLQSGQHRANEAERQRQVLEQHQRLARLERHKLKLRGDDVLWQIRRGTHKSGIAVRQAAQDRSCSTAARQACLQAQQAGEALLASRPIHRRQYKQSCPV